MGKFMSTLRPSIETVEIPAPSMQPTGELSLQTVAMPADTNWFGDVFGGWLVSQMDLAGAVRARRRANGRVATISIEHMVFHVPVKVGNVIACYTQIIHEGTTSLRIFTEVWEIHDMTKPPVRLTEGLFTFVAIDDTGRKRPLPALADLQIQANSSPN